MNIYHLQFSKTGIALSGGEVAMLGIVKSLAAKGHSNIILTTDNGKIVYEQDLVNIKKVNFVTIQSYKSEKKYGPMGSYLYRMLLINKAIKTIKLDKNDLLICHSDFFPDSIPAWLINKRNPHIKSINFYHMKAPSLFRGFNAEYAGKFSFPTPQLLHYKLNQFMYRKLTYDRTLILTVNSFYKEYLQKKYNHNTVKVLKSFGGIEKKSEQKIDQNRKKYDVIWIGRFHVQKGLDDLLDTIFLLKQDKPDISAVIIGDGDQKIKAHIAQKIIDLGLETNIYLPGFVHGSEKYKYIYQSRVFLMTSHYESFGIVVLEAMSCGLPVIAYNLPVYDVFKNGIIKVNLLDINAMKNKTIEVLLSKKKYDTAKKNALAISSEHSWQKTTEEMLGYL